MAAWINSAEKSRWMDEAVRSVLSSSFQDLQLVIVDDASGESIQANYHTWYGEPRVRWLRLPRHSGPGKARNVGVRASSGEYIFCLDADDCLCSGGLAALWERRHPLRYIYGDVRLFGTTDVTKALEAWSLEELWRVRGPIGVTALQHRNVWRALGGWREDLDGLEDIEFWIRAARIGVAGEHIDSVTFQYRQHPDSRTERFKSAGKHGDIALKIREMHRAFFEGRT